MTAPKIGALQPWYGSKRTLAPRIVAELGPHRAFWDLLCGSCSILLAKPRATYESVNDLHEDLINLALVVQLRETAEQLYDRCRRTLFDEDLAKLASERLQADFEPTGDAERAYWYLVKGWFGVNGVAGTPENRTGSFCVRYSSKGGNGATRWKSVSESIPDWHERLLGVQITRKDAFELVERIEDRAGTVVYADPPYLEKSARYVHDFAAADHGRLATALRRFQATRVLVSYYAHPSLADLYPGWTLVDCSLAKSMVNSGMRDDSGVTVAPEVLLTNGPSLTQPAAKVIEATPDLFSPR